MPIGVRILAASYGLCRTTELLSKVTGGSIVGTIGDAPRRFFHGPAAELGHVLKTTKLTENQVARIPL